MIDRGAVEDLARSHRLELVLLFGSAVSGGARRDSDLDIAVHAGGRALPIEELSGLTHELQLLSPERAVDLAVLDHADPLFLKQVTDRCALLAGSPRRLAELKIYAFKRYHDHRRYLALEREHVRRTLRELVRS